MHHGSNSRGNSANCSDANVSIAAVQHSQPAGEQHPAGRSNPPQNKDPSSRGHHTETVNAFPEPGQAPQKPLHIRVDGPTAPSAYAPTQINGCESSNPNVSNTLNNSRSSVGGNPVRGPDSRPGCSPLCSPIRSGKVHSPYRGTAILEAEEPFVLRGGNDSTGKSISPAILATPATQGTTGSPLHALPQSMGYAATARCGNNTSTPTRGFIEFPVYGGGGGGVGPGVGNGLQSTAHSGDMGSSFNSALSASVSFLSAAKTLNVNAAGATSSTGTASLAGSFVKTASPGQVQGSPSPNSSASRRGKNVCRHFLEGKCNRGSACRFYHPGSKHKVVTSTCLRTPKLKPITPLADLEKQREEDAAEAAAAAARLAEQQQQQLHTSMNASQLSGIYLPSPQPMPVSGTTYPASQTTGGGSIPSPYLSSATAVTGGGAATKTPPVLYSPPQMGPTVVGAPPPPMTSHFSSPQQPSHYLQQHQQHHQHHQPLLQPPQHQQPYGYSPVLSAAGVGCNSGSQGVRRTGGPTPPSTPNNPQSGGRGVAEHPTLEAVLLPSPLLDLAATAGVPAHHSGNASVPRRNDPYAWQPH